MKKNRYVSIRCIDEILADFDTPGTKEDRIMVRAMLWTRHTDMTWHLGKEKYNGFDITRRNTYHGSTD